MTWRSRRCLERCRWDGLYLFVRFRSGGEVGSGGVQYKVTGGPVSEGGAAMIDMSQVSNAFQGFSEQMTTINGSLNGIANKLETIAGAFQNISMNHFFSGDIAMSVNISNKDAIIAAVQEGIMPDIQDLILWHLQASANTFRS